MAKPLNSRTAVLAGLAPYAILLILLLIGVAVRLQLNSPAQTVLQTLKVLGLFLLIGGALRVLEMLWPDHPESKADGENKLGDATSFVVTATYIGRITASLTVFGFGWLVFLHIPRLPPTWLSEQPRILQMIETLFIKDFLTYLKHRLMHHNKFLWKFHAVHHSSEDLTWHSAFRVHPGEEILSTVLTLLPVYCLGFKPPIIGAVLTFTIVYEMMLHANIPFDFGPLKYLFVSPAFHRWHHTCEEAHVDKNFGSMLSCFDWILGTAYLPQRSSTAFGLIGEDAGNNYWTFFAFPFKSMQEDRQKRKDQKLSSTIVTSSLTETSKVSELSEV
jgi:sterol desaturase/sphingolipid hydroxylase (fatty acid hydroxylase superfamily)